MLTHISIRDVVLISALDLDFFGGFNALTGETGAGKSILLDSLSLALGARSDAGLVRKGSERAIVTATFEMSSGHPVFAQLADMAIDRDGDTVILRRMVGVDGKSKAFINDQPVTVAALREVGTHLVEIHGQFDTQGLLDPSTHIDLLDAYGGHEVEREAVTALYTAWRAAEKKRDSAAATIEQAAREEAYLRQSIDDLDALNPETGEEESLSQKRSLLMNREAIMDALHQAHEALAGENGAEVAIGHAGRILDRVADKLGDAGTPLLDALSRASAEIEEALNQITVLSGGDDSGEHSLEAIDDRLHALRAQARKHNCTVDELPALRDDLAGQLAMIEGGSDSLQKLEQSVHAARAAYFDAAKKLSSKRHKTVIDLDQKVMAELPPLKLEKAVFKTALRTLGDDECSPRGLDHVQFTVATNPGSNPGPMNKIASGGELARFTLALKVVMAGTGSVPTMIFDEIDTGIGGSTAAAAGERLMRLARDKQVLVVTHSPQVASHAANHYVVSKAPNDQAGTTTGVTHLSTIAEREEEIARMLSGASISPEARAAASKLLEPVLKHTGS